MNIMQYRVIPYIADNYRYHKELWRGIYFDFELTGICCINMDDTVKDENVDAIFEARKELLEEAGAL
jgi:hypothetical protein